VEVSVKYLILIYGNPASREIWAGLSEAQRKKAVQGYVALNEELAATGEGIEHHALTDPSHSKRVTVRAERTMTTDGPFTEVKEQLAGFYLVERDSIQRAVEHAARIPEAALGLIEVRPIQDLSSLGL
jgi:hypothetical protein